VLLIPVAPTTLPRQSPRTSPCPKLSPLPLRVARPKQRSGRFGSDGFGGRGTLELRHLLLGGLFISSPRRRRSGCGCPYKSPPTYSSSGKEREPVNLDRFILLQFLPIPFFGWDRGGLVKCMCGLTEREKESETATMKFHKQSSPQNFNVDISYSKSPPVRCTLCAGP